MARVGARRLSPAVRGLPFGLVVVGSALVGVATALAAVRLPATPGEARLVEAAVAVVGPARAAPVTVGLDQLAARVQLSTYAELTGAFPRHVTALAGARELALLACAGLLLALLALMRSLGVRPPAALLVLSVLALCPPAIAALARFGPGLLGVMWLTVGAALLARLRPGLRMIGLPAVAVGVVSAPVLAVPLLVIAAALLVAERAQRGALLLALAVPVSVAPLALLMPPAGGSAVPALVVVTVLGAFVLVDEVVTRLVRRSPRIRGSLLGGIGVVAVVAGVLVLLPVPSGLSRARPVVPAAPGPAGPLGSATGPDARAIAPAAESSFLGALLADNPNLRAPDGVRVLLWTGAVDDRPLAVLVSLAARGPVTVADLPPVPGDDPGVLRHRAVLVGIDAPAREWLAAQRPPYQPTVTTTADETVVTWPVPGPDA
jgi:hypothetical protein